MTRDTGPMDHTEFRSILREALVRLDERYLTGAPLPASVAVVDGDRMYMLDAIAASERFDIDAATVKDALAIAADY